MLIEKDISNSHRARTVNKNDKRYNVHETGLFIYRTMFYIDASALSAIMPYMDNKKTEIIWINSAPLK